MAAENNSKTKGIIVKGVGGLYTVRLADGSDVLCRARGIFRHEKITPLVGDRVVVSNDIEGADITVDGNEKKKKPSEKADISHVIDEILERKSSLIRPALANLTHLFTVIPSAKPKPDIYTVDKLISIAESREIEPVIIVNKCDIDPDESKRIYDIYTLAGFDCFALSASSGEGCDRLLDYLKSLTDGGREVVAAFAGASAAGKSTLMSRLFKNLDLATGDVSRKIERGRHTTRHVELYNVEEVPRMFIADTPGFSMLDFARFNFYGLDELPYTFREFREHLGKCRYTKCTHLKEEECSIMDALEKGEISKSRHDSYVALYEEIKKKPEWQRKKEERV